MSEHHAADGEQLQGSMVMCRPGLQLRAMSGSVAL